MKRKAVYVTWIPMAVMCVLIFCFSQKPAEESSGMSDGITVRVARAVQTVTGDQSLTTEEKQTELVQYGKILSPYIRKSAHFAEFFLLGGCTAIFFISCGFRRRKVILPAILLCVCYAVSDEIHQMFVDGRAGRLTDVCIDSAGAAVGILLTYLVVVHALQTVAFRRQVCYDYKSECRK